MKGERSLAVFRNPIKSLRGSGFGLSVADIYMACSPGIGLMIIDCPYAAATIS